MKKILNLGIALMSVLLIILPACQKDAQIDGLSSNLDDNLVDRANANNKVFATNTVPFGKSYASWTQEWWRYVMQFPCEVNPLNDETGIHTDAKQSGPVYFLFGNSGGTSSRKAVVPRGKGVLFPVINFINDAPCPDVDYTLEPGTTLEDYLKAGAAALVGMSGNLNATLDGKPISHLEQFRVPTDLFYFVGDPDLTTCLDPCITGIKQAAVSDGYWLLLKPLSPGKHTLQFHGELPQYGFVLDVTYQLDVL